MKRNVRFITQAAIIAALYASISYAQAAIFPGSQAAAVQFRVSEALMVLCFFTPAALPGLTLGCAVTNVLSGFPADILFGSVATLISCYAMWMTRNCKLLGFPLFPLFFPVITNALIVGAELQFFMIGSWNFFSFLLQAVLVGVGELGVMLILGIPFYYLIMKTRLHSILK